MTGFAERRSAMVDCQIRPSDVTRFPIIEAMLQLPREEFVPEAKRQIAYVGDHVELEGGRVLLDPRIQAKMLDALEIRSDELVLDIGGAMGYSTALIARMAEAVISVEENPDLSAEAAAKLVDHEVYNAVTVNAPLAEGAPQHGPYDSIAIQGGAEVLPDAIVDQLKDGGKIACILVDRPPGACKIGTKTGGRIVWRMAFNAHAPILKGFERNAEFTFE